MSSVSILDCTLRDGGYINDWRFGQTAIRNIMDRLTESNVEIIECGFLRDEPYNPERVVFNEVGQIEPFIYPKKKGLTYVAMIAVGDISAESISPCDGRSIDGLRLSFHRHEWVEVLNLAEKVRDLGYKVFLQPVGTSSYSDHELLRLLDKVNLLNPYAFYIVDTLGLLHENDLLHLFFLVDRNLAPGINIGFHSHNNLQLSYSNALAILRLHVSRNIIIDASVLGMGRAAGNLCIEMITRYINENIASKYDIKPFLDIVDNYLGSIFHSTPWGYSVPYFLAAVNGVHPNYATYLINKQTIPMRVVERILSGIPSEKKELFDRELIEKRYLADQADNKGDSDTVEKLKRRF